MSQSAYQPEQLLSFRQAAAELAEFRKNAEIELEEAATKGDLKTAQYILEQASLKTKAYEELRDKLGPIGIFLAKYGVEVINDHTILFVLPKGCSRIDILHEAQGLVGERDNRNLIYPERLEEWHQEDRFANSAEASERICIDGHVKGGDAKDRATQEKFVAGKGLALPSIEDLSVAFALHWVATGEPLFGRYDQSIGSSYWVRGAGGSLGFDHDGLSAFRVYVDGGRHNVAVAARVFPESK